MNPANTSQPHAPDGSPPLGHGSQVQLSIVHVLSSFGVGGQERVALDLAIGQKARGHRVAVLSLAPEPDGPIAAELGAAGIEVGRVPKHGGLDITLVPRLARAFWHHGAQIVHTHNPLPLIYGGPAARLVGARVVHTKHGINPGGRGHRWLRRTAARLAHAFVAVSDTTAEQALALQDAPRAKLHTIPNGIRLDRYAPDAVARAQVRAELGLGETFVIGTVGRIDSNKNHAMLIRAAAPLLARGDVRIVIVGEGPDRAELAESISALADQSRVILTGRRMDVPRVVQAFDAFALPSKSEGLPLAVPEAMAAGLPVVATSVGGLPSVIDDGVTGYLVPVSDKAFGVALAALVNDRAGAREMGLRARKVALERFSADRMVDGYLALYES